MQITEPRARAALRFPWQPRLSRLAPAAHFGRVNAKSRVFVGIEQLEHLVGFGGRAASSLGPNHVLASQ